VQVIFLLFLLQWQCLLNLQKFININKPLQQAVIAGKVFLDLIDEKPEYNSSNKYISIGDIKFQKVSFSYGMKSSSLKN